MTYQFPTTPWLFPEEHEEVVRMMLKHTIIKFSNARDLPLKGGGKTDIYINLRNMRSSSEFSSFLADRYSLALRRLPIQRFVEVPEAVSGLASLIQARTSIPYLTIREEKKAGHATSARTIGSYAYGENVVIVDDVVTDGDSKIAPFQTCQSLGLNVLGIVVLVDRQQGWQQHLASHGVHTNVWAGMTLHDVRYQLVHMGLMKRCDPEVEQANPLIIALDGKSWVEVLPIVEQVRTTGCILKVNDLLLSEGSERLLPKLSTYGRVMADPKFFDISNTVENSCRRLRACPPWAVTVHAAGNSKMISAAKRALEGTSTLVFAVTVLTSWDKETCQEVYHRLPLSQVKVLAQLANQAGADGFVCSPRVAELAYLKKNFPTKPRISPGIRSAGVAAGDQKRFETPAAAMANGANFLVGGRQFLEADDPVKEIRRVLTDELRITL